MRHTSRHLAPDNPIDPLIQQIQAALQDQYTIERELGGGGMSRVLLARDTALDRQVVIKILPQDFMAGVSIERFRREIQLAAQLQHANIVPVLAAGDAAGIPYYTMPFVQGNSLRERMTAEGKLPIAEVVTLMRDVARALASAHAAGVAHRDIKPENVLLSGGAAVVTDFGIAKAISASRIRNSPADTAAPDALTQLGTSVGTPAYMAPEQAAGDPDTDHRADIYALGVISYEMLAGAPMFRAKTAHELVVAHMSETPAAIGTLRPDTPPALAALVMQCVEKNPEARPASANAVLAALDGISTTTTPTRNVPRTFAIYAASFIAAVFLSRLAVTGIGLPAWVFPATLIVMALGLPAVLLLSTRQVLRGGIVAVAVLILSVSGYMAMRAFGIGPAGSLFGKGVLKERDGIVVSDFHVVHADSTFGAVLAEAVRMALSQSDVLTIATSTDVQDALKMMRRDAATPLDLPVARDVALRLNAKAVVDGDVAGVPGGYLISLRMVTADSGVQLAAFHAAADGPGGLIKAADSLARQLRAKSGESLRRVQGTPDLYWQTTSSVDALRNFALAIDRARRADFEASIAFDRKAVALDSNFAMAWSNLAGMLRDQGMREAADSAQQHAWSLREHLSDWERLVITGSYYGFPNQRDPAKSAAAFQELLDRGDSDGPLGSLGTLRLNQRDYARAEPLLRASMRQTQTPGVVLNLIPVLYHLGKATEAAALLDTARALAPAYFLTPRWAAEFAYQRGDYAAVQRIADSLRNSTQPTQRIWGAERLADLALLQGQVGPYERYMREAAAGEKARNNAHDPIEDSIWFAYRDVWMSPTPAHGIARLDAAAAHTPLDGVEVSVRFLAAITYAIGGHPDRARTIIAHYDAQKIDSVVRRLTEPSRHRVMGEIALAEKRWRDAFTEFRHSDTTALGNPADVCRTCLFALLGRAFDQAGMTDSAIVMYEQFLNTPYFMRGTETHVPQDAMSDPFWLPPIHKRLGELYEEKKDRARALAHYEKFLDLWKNADPEFQGTLSAVRARMGALRGQ